MDRLGFWGGVEEKVFSTGKGIHLAITGIEKGRFCNDFPSTITPLIGVAALPAEQNFFPILTELASETAIRFSKPDLLEGIFIEIA